MKESASAALGKEEPAAILEVSSLTKEYGALKVLSDVTFSLAAGSTCAIVGPSGSGKSTLLGLCAGLDRPTSGSVRLAGRDLAALNEDERAGVRNRLIGFVFQSFQLIPTLTALENVMAPLELRGEKGARPAAEELLSRVGLRDRVKHYPAQLSGGEQQRTALARAFVNRPKILFADEPTGNLDAETSVPIVEMIFELNAAHGTALVLVTHDLELARRTQRLLKIRGGKVTEQSV